MAHLGNLAHGDHPARDVAAEDVEHDVAVELGPLAPTPEDGDRSPGFRFLVR
jgi:hypothetical protein